DHQCERDGGPVCVAHQEHAARDVECGGTEEGDSRGWRGDEADAHMGRRESDAEGEEMNHIICPVRNNLHLTKRAVATFLAQDVGDVQVILINNASSVGSNEWIAIRKEIASIYFNPPLSVAASWNFALQHVFYGIDETYALVVNNDVELRPDTYR